MCNTPHALTDVERATRSNLMECMICFDSVPRDQCFEPQEADACRHYLCRECASAYLRSKIDSGSLSSLRCCADKCARPLSAVEMQSGLSERDYKRYQRFLRLQQLAADPTIVFCSSSGCDVALFGGPGVAQLQCPDCKRSVCFVCRVPWHEHQSCAEYRHSQSQLSEVAKAAQVAAGERLFSEYLHRNGGQFRQCKRCYSWIEKTEGWSEGQEPNRRSAHVASRCSAHQCSFVLVFLALHLAGSLPISAVRK
jgi:hypothetical protein